MSRQLFNIILFFLPFVCSAQYTVQEYYEFLEELKQSPKDYIFDLFKTNDIVILGERDHRETTQYDLILEILKDNRFINEIGHVYTEVGVVNQTNRGNIVVKGDYTKQEEFEKELVLLYRELDYNALWDKYNMIKYLKGVYAINKDLSIQEKITIGFTDCFFEWEGMTREKYLDFERKYLSTSNTRDSIMAYNFIELYEKQRPINGHKKALYIQNRPHAEKIDDIIGNLKVKTVGGYLKEKYRHQVKIVALNWYNYESENSKSPEYGKGHKIELSNEGKWDAAFELTGNKPIGFTLKETPFGQTHFDYPYGDDDKVLYQDRLDGIVFYKPFYEFSCTRGLPGIVDKRFAKELIHRQIISGVYEEGEHYGIEDEIEDWESFRTYDCVDYSTMIQQMTKWLDKETRGSK
ncbi:hypothetical protein [Myroides odoratimimus]|uniref:Uncharacterized protein n=2 Tax=Myroides odoratimimus TaxID=76832 RepID=A0AAI8G5K0_9FLAO|nr:hypothetical protein [Myroides odoratimimus]APA93413.1 hypothetical protein BK054_14505 [Myroides sp. ZB35]ALU27362.1 hypothetical protein AS202_14865 [Myroides odoratimimus]EKB06305.1 hypothetical protein HMPREF9711_00677 [Myroides odoratimimus CCUG 3837]MCO7723748.1 hypothetical protein [Myroides odoratimimus]MDM1039620.1 hypothetical protein [Myroides odoratimimus]